MKKSNLKKDNFINNLNKAQLEAVTHDKGPMLIVAGAGTGKTTVLIKRLAYLIQEKGVHPEQILLTTFTEKGAGEIEERSDKELPYGYVNLWINTFHGFCEKILRDNGLEIGLNPAFKVLSTTEQWIFIKKHLDDFSFDYYKPLGDPTKFIHEIIKHFSRLKDENIDPKDYLKLAEELKANTDKIKSASDLSDDLDATKINELAEGYHTYNRLLLKENFLDFGDLLLYTVKLFKERPNILKKYHEQFKYIMVDEFQDTNTIQYELVKMLAAPENNIVAVGDDDQSIYRFRGASLSNIMQFKDDFPKSKEVILTENYRSSQLILDKAHDFISHNNPNRLEEKLKIDKKLVSKIKTKGEADFLQFDTEFEETQSIAEAIKKLHQNKKIEQWAEIAILVRANDTADKFVKELTRQNIPNHFVSLKGLYYKAIIIDILSYLKLLDDYHEPSALYQVLNIKSFRIDHEDMIILTKWARKKLWSLFETLQKHNVITELSDKAHKNIEKLLRLVNEHAHLAKEQRVAKVFIRAAQDCLLEHLDQDKNQEEYSYLNQFYSKIKSFEASNEQGQLKDFLNLINLEMEAGETGGLRFNYDDADTVKIMTVHAAKGLEFSYVFIVNAVDRKFPVDNRSDKIQIPEQLGAVKTQGKDAHLEEERRLFYVAMTRAKYGLFVTGARDYGGLRDKKPSKFISEASLPIISSESNIKTELERDLKANDAEAEPIQFALPETFSFSQLTAYENCPLNYKFIYILKIPTEDAPQAIFGRCIHNCLRQFYLPLLENSFQPSLFEKNKVDKKLLDLKNLLNYYESYWNDYGYEDKSEAAKYKKNGKEMLIKFHKAEEKNKPQIIFLEKKFNLKIDKYILNGTIDRVDQLEDGSVEIIDYKTGDAPNLDKTLDFKRKRQLLLYQAALEEVFGKKVSKLSFYYLKVNKKASFVAKGEEIIKVKEEMLKLIEAIRKGDFSVPKGNNCNYCQHGPVAS